VCSSDLTHQTLIEDWSGLIPGPMIGAMTHAIGVHGSPAHALAHELASQVDIPWDAALTVFAKRDMPKWTAVCRKALPNFDKLHPHCKGSLVSLAYNRGAGGFGDARDRFREMRAIKAHMAAGEFNKIAWRDDHGNLHGEFISMVRLWPDVRGLRDRRVKEAAWFVKGLALPVAAPPVVPPAPALAPEPVKPAAEPVQEPAPKPAKPAPAPKPVHHQSAPPATAQNPLLTLLEEIEHALGAK